MAARAAEMIGQLVRRDGEEIGLQFAAVIEIGKTVEEADEGLLHDVFAGGAVADASLNESEQPAFIPRDERFPARASP